ncbi:hypothetical protein SAMN04488498_1684 [Mesorhizobium albiziae]|uniref:Uncharacterized protein n=1 Tax=Neomesorhizobium albiziae TaxID=335020 RepID=A0A1I4FYN9_9HYPH|nr:hypothetical protein SAMN04488498_1684 [Mesorhizobium albiziae]
MPPFSLARIQAGYRLSSIVLRPRGAGVLYNAEGQARSRATGGHQ